MSLAEIREGFCPVPGGLIYYQLAGSGPPVVLIHAGIADHRMWDAQMAALTPHYTVLRYDCRNYGRTTTEPVAFSNRQDLADLMDHLSITRAAVVGCSRGGMLALDFAIERPERVSALGWVCSGVSGWQPPDELFSAEDVALWNKMEAAEKAHDWEQVATLDVRAWVDGPLQPEGRADPAVRKAVYEMALNNYTVAQVAGAEPQPMQPAALGRLGELRAPTLAFVGDLDSADTPAAADMLAANALNVRVEHFPDAAHLPNMERPEQFNALLLEFLGQYIS
jgi:pimeloyl-ACP methyl ester carboxylesterase